MAERTDILWTPSNDFILNSGLKKYESWLEEEFNLRFKNYEDFWRWSNEHYEDFWESLSSYFDIQFHSNYERIIDTEEMPGARWFSGATLNYAEHIFRMKSEDRPALIFANETGDRKKISWGELEQQVTSVQAFLVSKGITKGDRVAGYLPNTPETIACFLAVNSLGAVWSCCSPDFGINTVIDRFEQIEPESLLYVRWISIWR